MLNVLGNTDKVFINLFKSNIVHFHNPSKTKSNVVYKVNGETVEYASHYKYLGSVLSEHRDYTITAKVVPQSANIALGLLIVKYENENIWWPLVRCIY